MVLMMICCVGFASIKAFQALPKASSEKASLRTAATVDVSMRFSSTGRSMPCLRLTPGVCRLVRRPCITVPVKVGAWAAWADDAAVAGRAAGAVDPATVVEAVDWGAAEAAGAAVCIAAIWFSGPPKSPSSSRGSVVGIVG